MNDVLDVYEVGTKVFLTKEIKAKIVTVALHTGGVVQYECAWWNGEARIRDWFSEDDILRIVEDEPKRKIGFYSE